MIRKLATAALALVLTVHAASAAPNCKTGIPCGDTCIAQGKECHIAPPPAKQCKTGKPCGDSCIAADKVCHK